MDRGALWVELLNRFLPQAACGFLFAMPLPAMFLAPLRISPRARGGLFCIGLAVLAVASGPQVQAATIYQCKQAGGGVAFQEKPCAPSDTQSVLKPTTRTAPAQAAPAAQASRGTPAAPAAPEGDQAACHQAGRKVFDPSRPQELQHPQAALNLCRKAVPATQNANGQCLQACVQAWADEYQMKYALPRQ